MIDRIKKSKVPSVINISNKNSIIDEDNDDNYY